MDPMLVFCCCIMCFISGLGVRDRDFQNCKGPTKHMRRRKKLIRKIVRRCALLFKSSTKLTLQQTGPLDFKIALQQCMVLNKFFVIVTVCPLLTYYSEMSELKKILECKFNISIFVSACRTFVFPIEDFRTNRFACKSN